MGNGKPAEGQQQKDKKAFWARLSASPLSQTLAIFSGIMAGVLLEDHSRDIFKAVDLRRGADLFQGRPLWWAVLFYALVILTVVLTVAGQVAQDRDRRAEEARREEAEKSLLGQTADLQEQTERVEQTSADLRVQTETLVGDSHRLMEQTTSLGAQSNRLLAGSEDLLQRSNQLIEQTRELREQTDELRDLIQTLPPKTILTAYVKTAQTCRLTHLDAYDVDPDDEEAPEQIGLAIRTVLGAVASLFQVYENAPPSSVIAANLMLFSPAEALRRLSFDERREWERSLTFAPPGTSLSELTGVLVLVKALSTRTDVPGYAPDPALVHLRLPVPNVTKSTLPDGKPRWRVLPGAPLAWVRREAVAYPDQEAFLQWITENGPFDTTVVEAMRAYMDGDGSGVRSFVSIPLVRLPSADQGLASENRERAGENMVPELPVGILNIHSNQIGLLRDRRPDENLYVLLYPIVDILIDLLVLLQDAEDEGRRRHEG